VAQALVGGRLPSKSRQRSRVSWRQRLLSTEGFASFYWATFNQARHLGGSVRKGERSTPCVFWKWIEKRQENPETGETETAEVPVLRYYNLFNVSQCDGISHSRLDAPDEERTPFNPIEAAEAIVAGYPDPPSISGDGGASAYYRPRTDSIHIPARETFESEEHYYATLFHEITHSTGSEKRLARPGVTNPTRFGSHGYSHEEMVAEMGSAFLLAEAGIDSEPLVDNSAAYIASWLKALRDDPKLVVLAAARAQKAVEYIRGRGVEHEEETPLARAA
jgi:antirestriction protein ArdC